MYYGKLPILLLAQLSASSPNSTNSQIASYILNHLEEVRDSSIRDLASKCYVSLSSISRFCRDMGLNDFAELRELIAETDLKFEIASESDDPETQKKDYLTKVRESLFLVEKSLDMKKVERLVEDIDRFLYDRESVSPESNVQVEGPENDPEERAAARRQQFFLRWNASKVSWLAGSFLLLLVSTGLMYFLWNFWIRDLFNPAVRVTLPDFQGQNYDTVSMDPDYLSTYSFHVLYLVDTDHAPGTILSQSPNPGRSIMMTPGGVEVNLSVATGDTVATVPDVSNLDYRTATAMLRQVGLYIEVINAYAETVDRDRVIRTEPSAGMEVNTTSLIYVYVSCGTEKRMLTVPNLIGLSEEAAISQIESNGFSYGWSQREHSDLMAGTVVGQSLSAFSTEEEHSMIYLTVSDGPVVNS